MDLIELSKFQLGQILATPGALEALESSGERLADFLCKHAAGYWGELSDEGAALNDEAVKDRSRIHSAYQTNTGTNLWIITDAEDDTGNRQATTILLPTEY